MGRPGGHARRHGSLTIEIRLATEADVPGLPDIELSGAQSFRGYDMPEAVFLEASPAERWLPALAAGTIWVTQDAAGELVGFLAGARHGDRLHIDEFNVIQSAQRRGLGRRILGRVIDWARRERLSSLSLTTFRFVPWNAPFYASCGFEVWEEDLPQDIEAELASGAAKGLRDRCAMRLLL